MGYQEIAGTTSKRANLLFADGKDENERILGIYLGSSEVCQLKYRQIDQYA